MNNYVIVTDSCSDMQKEFRDKYGIRYIPVHYTIHGTEYVTDLDWKNISPRDFYDMIRKGERITCAAINEKEYEKFFSEFLSAGLDVLYLGCSSALSASVKTSFIVREKLKEQFPERKLICIDTLRAGCVLTLINIEAAKLKEAGKTLEEVADFVEKEKLKFNQEGTVDSLTYLKRAGRVSLTSAFFGGMFNVKPIIIADAKGQNAAIEKIMGKAKAFARIADRVAEKIQLTPEHDKILISQSDCMDDANKIQELITERLAAKGLKADFYKCHIGAAIGGSVGPGTIMVAFYGKEVDYTA